MVLNYVWISFFIISFVVALFKSLQAGNIEIYTTIVEAMLKTAKVAVVDIGIPLAGAMISQYQLLQL